ncbi:hypothetical protein [Roseateles saccharophilus]|uniref:hypothetical protein n=1 Tax=Roseateles saccharophilus TaxID=304 RepID=UPI001046531B|nr:hypothetical protein [Roseateles saccharophilus]MDG0836160.1 hypothetical protein [Roseateles saccharophilus]
MFTNLISPMAVPTIDDDSAYHPAGEALLRASVCVEFGHARLEGHQAFAPMDARLQAMERGGTRPRRPPKVPHLWPLKLLHLAGVN